VWSNIYICLHVLYPLFLSDLNEFWTISTDFGNILISNFMKIPTVRAELFWGETERQTDRQTDWLNEWLTDWLTDMTKLIVDFRNFANEPKKERRDTRRGRVACTTEINCLISCEKLKERDHLKYTCACDDIILDKPVLWICAIILWLQELLSCVEIKYLSEFSG